MENLWYLANAFAFENKTQKVYLQVDYNLFINFNIEFLKY